MCHIKKSKTKKNMATKSKRFEILFDIVFLKDMKNDC